MFDLTDKLTSGQAEVFEHIRNGENVLVTGIGGSGKSYLLGVIKRWAEDAGKNCIVCSPTGIAALNIGGSTIHRTLGIGPDQELEVGRYQKVAAGSALDLCDIFIIDEISMCRCDLFDYVSDTLRRINTWREKTGDRLIQLVAVGDFYQLPPVVKPEVRKVLHDQYASLGHEFRDGYAFEGIWWDYWNFVTIPLTEAVRQTDAEFVDALNKCRQGRYDGLDWLKTHVNKCAIDGAIELCGTNKAVNEINKSHLDALRGRRCVYHGWCTGTVGKGDKPTLEDLELKVGARVMVLINDDIDTYMNGSLGYVTRMLSNGVMVRFDNSKECFIGVHTWNITRPKVDHLKVKQEIIGSYHQIPLKLAWAMTIHKSQGQTFEAANVHPNCFSNGQLYVALSRVRDVNKMHFVTPLRYADLRVSKSVLEFYKQHDLPLSVA